MNSTRQLPGSMHPQAPRSRSLRRFPGLGRIPPWTDKQVIAPVGYANESVEWVPIALLVPRKSFDATFSTPMRSTTGNFYPAIVLGVELGGGKVQIFDGHHRYHILVDGGYEGLVPVVRRKNKLPGAAFFL